MSLILDLHNPVSLSIELYTSYEHLNSLHPSRLNSPEQTNLEYPILIDFESKHGPTKYLYYINDVKYREIYIRAAGLYKRALFGTSGQDQVTSAKFRLQHHAKTLYIPY